MRRKGKMVNKISLLLTGVFLTLVSISCVSTKTYTANLNNVPAEELITITGKSGVYFEGVDDENFKKTRSIQVTEGEHILKVGVEKGNTFFTSKITTSGYALKRIYAVAGKNMCVDAIILDKGPSTTTTLGNYRETTTSIRMAYIYRLDTADRLGTTKKVLKDPEKLEIEDCPKEIEILTELPADRKFIIVGNLKTELSGALYSYSKIKNEIVYKLFLNEACANDIDALVDIYPYSKASMYLKGYSGLGIKFIE